jgi:hypothetical protein
MGRPLTATRVAVQAAMEALRQAGASVTVLNVRQHVGGGSLSTIARTMADIRRQGGWGSLPSPAPAAPAASAPGGSSPAAAAVSDDGAPVLAPPTASAVREAARIEALETTIQQLETALGDGERGWHETREECDRLRARERRAIEDLDQARQALEQAHQDAARIASASRARLVAQAADRDLIAQLTAESALQRQAMLDRDAAMQAQTDAFRACLAAYAAAQERERESQAERVDALQRACRAVEARATALAEDLALRTRIAAEALAGRDRHIAQLQAALAALEMAPWAPTPADPPSASG